MGLLKKQKPKIYLSRNNKSKIFYVYHPNLKTGKMTRNSTGTKNKNKAMSIFVKFKEEYSFRQEGTKSIPILEFAEIFTNYKKNSVVSAVNRNYFSELKRLDKFFNGKITLDKLTQQHIEDYKDFLFKEGYKDKTIKEKFNRIFVVLKYAKQYKYIPKEVDIIMPRISIPERLPKFLTPDKILELLANCKNQDMKDIIQIAYLTGMRIGELINLKWEQVNWEHKFISLDNNNEYLTKSRRVRTVPLITETIAILKNRFDKKTCDYVFTFKSKKWTAYFWILFRKLIIQTFGEKSGLTFHSLRHSFASNLRNSGTDISIVKQLLGHANISTTMIYTYLAPNTLHDAVEKLSIKNLELEPEFSKN